MLRQVCSFSRTAWMLSQPDRDREREWQVATENGKEYRAKAKKSGVSEICIEHQ